ncbi:hypothetical protein CGCVW01_v008496 [Colletotrichum viniferum]|nr:hypothetical protein CGCVW01_v008496 [Colletotrichum viniferum]
MRRRIWLQATASVVLLGAAHAQLDSLPPCGISCVNTVIAKGFGCASQDNSCLCKQQDFVFGVRDCASQSCGADVATKVNDYVTSLCASMMPLGSTDCNPGSSCVDTTACIPAGFLAAATTYHARTSPSIIRASPTSGYCRNERCREILVPTRQLSTGRCNKQGDLSGCPDYANLNSCAHNYVNIYQINHQVNYFDLDRFPGLAIRIRLRERFRKALQ